MRWLDLLFAHWSVDPATLRPLIPGAFEIEPFEDRAWLGVVSFVMADVAPRGVPALPRFSRFPEVNVRTYVTYRGQPGVWFLSLDAASRLTVAGGRRLFHVPYHHADMASRHQADTVIYRSRRTGMNEPPAEFAATYRPLGPVTPPEPGSVDAWATDRPRLFAVDRHGAVWRTEIRHPPWPLQPAEATIDATPIVAALGITLPPTPPILAFSARLDVRAWPPVRA
jgi:uncharacterized protein